MQLNVFVLLCVAIFTCIIIINWNFIVNCCIKFKHTWLKIPLDKEACYRNLDTLHDTFAKHDVTFWLSEGTALGFTRGGDFIDYDDDLDIGIWHSDRERFTHLVLPDLVLQGFTFAFSKMNDTFYTLHRHGEKVDIDITGPNNMCMANEDHCIKLIPHLQNLQNIQIRGKIYKIPNVSYLQYLYGPDWQTPIQGQKVVK